MKNKTINSFDELFDLLNNNYDYLVIRGLNYPLKRWDKDIDILISFGTKIPSIEFNRELHFQNQEEHKGIVFVPNSALKRKRWNGEYFELGRMDKLRMKVWRKIRSIKNNFGEEEE